VLHGDSVISCYAATVSSVCNKQPHVKHTLYIPTLISCLSEHCRWMGNIPGRENLGSNLGLERGYPD